SDSGTNAEAALTSVYKEYSENDFISLVVTDSGNKNDCITTAGDIVSRGVEGVSTAGSIYGLGGLYGLWSVEPTVAIGAQLFHIFTQKSMDKASKSNELIKFAHHSGGYVLDICKPTFGKALAHRVLKHMDMEKQLPEECHSLHSDMGK
ncbi:MAG: hypothetical protein OXC37_02335, partial [Bdellovibrionaceae bacterium]|nr:hypothetical protein [Pseudobdellovibrionaceae bacterium]